MFFSIITLNIKLLQKKYLQYSRVSFFSFAHPFFLNGSFCTQKLFFFRVELQEDTEGGSGNDQIWTSDQSVLSPFVCRALEPTTGALRLRRFGPSPSFSEKHIRVALSGLLTLRRTPSGEVKEGDIMKGVAPCLSLPSFVECFVSLRRVSRWSYLAPLIFCDTSWQYGNWSCQGETLELKKRANS